MINKTKENYELLTEENKLLKSQIYILEKSYKDLTIKLRKLENNYNNDQKIYMEIQCKKLNEKCAILHNINNRLINKIKLINFIIEKNINITSTIGKLKKYIFNTDKNVIVNRLCKLDNEEKIYGHIILKNLDNKEKANIFTEVARTFIKTNPKLALKLAEDAWLEDPRGYRLKWWAFRAHDAGHIKLADVLLDYVPDSEIKRDEEIKKVKRIRNAAKNEYEESYKNQEDNYLTKEKIVGFYNKELKKQYEELKKNYEILFNEKCLRDYEYTKLEETKRQWSKNIDHAWDLAKIENWENMPDKSLQVEKTNYKVKNNSRSSVTAIDDNGEISISQLSSLDIIEIVKMHMNMIEKITTSCMKEKN